MRRSRSTLPLRMGGVFWSIFPSTGDTCVRRATAVIVGDRQHPSGAWRTYVGLRSARRETGRGGAAAGGAGWVVL
jgi:hypothetical protein